MKKILTIVGILSILGGINKVEAQLIPQFSQYMFNGLYINPAYAGYKDVMYGHVMYRKQWVDIESSPRTALISIDGPVGKGSNLGFNYANDKLGAAYSNSFMLDYAFKIKTSESGRLSFGLAAGMVQQGIDRLKLLDVNGNPTTDPRILNIETTWKPSFDAGIYFDSKYFFAGISVVGLFSKADDKAFKVIRTSTNYFFTTGFVIPISDGLRLMPSTFFGTDLKNPLKIDLNALFTIADKFSIGGSYRTGTLWFSDVKDNVAGQDNVKLRDAIALIAEVYLSERVRLGFAYDFDLNNLTQGHNGGFEVSLGYYLTKPKQRYVMPRYF